MSFFAPFLSFLLLSPEGAAASAGLTEQGWATRLKIELTNDYGDFSVDSCPPEAFENLQAEMYTWITDELLSIFGQEKFYKLSELKVIDSNDVFADKVEIEADFLCKLCGQKQWSTERSIHNVAYLLQWFTQMAFNEWMDENADILDGCMDDEDIQIDLFIEKIGAAENIVFQAAKAKFSQHAMETISMMSKD
jgi:hypothetical protein